MNTFTVSIWILLCTERWMPSSCVTVSQCEVWSVNCANVTFKFIENCFAFFFWQKKKCSLFFDSLDCYHERFVCISLFSHMINITWVHSSSKYRALRMPRLQICIFALRLHNNNPLVVMQNTNNEHKIVCNFSLVLVLHYLCVWRSTEFGIVNIAFSRRFNISYIA